jgi:hypothetical protein
MPGNTVTERTTPISKAKLPLSAEEYYEITKRFADPDKNFLIIMKDGKIYKSTIR